MFLSCLITSLFFAFTTGQLESFAALADMDNCSPPQDHQTTYKFPDCMDTESIKTNIADFGFDESSTEDMYEPEDAIDESYVLVAMNRSCWQPKPTLGEGCVFEIPDEDFDGSTLLGTKQVLVRFMCFVLVEHIQFVLILLMSWRNTDKSNSSKKSTELHRLHQVGSVCLVLQPACDPNIIASGHVRACMIASQSTLLLFQTIRLTQQSRLCSTT